MLGLRCWAACRLPPARKHAPQSCSLRTLALRRLHLRLGPLSSCHGGDFARSKAQPQPQPRRVARASASAVRGRGIHTTAGSPTRHMMGRRWGLGLTWGVPRRGLASQRPHDEAGISAKDLEQVRPWLLTRFVGAFVDGMGLAAIGVAIEGALVLTGVGGLAFDSVGVAAISYGLLIVSPVVGSFFILPVLYRFCGGKGPGGYVFGYRLVTLSGRRMMWIQCFFRPILSAALFPLDIFTILILGKTTGDMILGTRMVNDRDYFFLTKTQTR